MVPSTRASHALLTTTCRGLLSSPATVRTLLPTVSQQTHRQSLSTSARHSYRQQALNPPIPSPSARDDSIPPYPLGEHRVYKQSNKGLYGGARIRFGNRVSERNEVKTRRKWRPNVHQKRLWSESLGAFVRTRVTTRVLRTVDKVGGLDEYLLGGKSARLRELGPWGWRLRWRIMQTDVVKERFRRERAALGLPPREGEEEVLGLGEGEGEKGDVVLAAAGEEQAGVVAEGTSAAELIEETDRMIEKGDEFILDEGDSQGGFMKEEKPSKS